MIETVFYGPRTGFQRIGAVFDLLFSAIRQQGAAGTGKRNNNRAEMQALKGKQACTT
ncbi:hypothetical protein KUV26_16340 [Leisingera daeponensis]|uniref:Uncharacterized protein n=1 Tax=Leisingera daeponensis TaxID=405746 RepID=A0ABS7NII1_9RHOB|nr:hypothetical protein [Leisingera daeponensis]MBY6141010.1 hypothetical protein [Leisingera daeponensis]